MAVVVLTVAAGAQAEELPVTAPMEVQQPAAQAVAPSEAGGEATAPLAADMPSPPVAEAFRDCLQRDPEGRFLGWLDSQHCIISSRTAATAQWFDGLFGSWYGPEEAKVRLRVIVSERWDENLGLHAGNSIRASAILPNAKRRIKLVVGDDEDLLHRGQDLVNSLPGVSSTSAAIRWFPDIFSHVKYTFDLGVHSSPDIYTRVRARRMWHLGDDSVLHFTETLKYGVNDKTRSTTQLDAERALDDKTAFLLSNALYYWEREPDPVGLRWAQNWVILHRVSQKRSVSYGFIFEGVQQPDWHLESKGVFALYRQSFWRPWLYAEIEPHLTRRKDTAWEAVPSVILRLEAQFGF